MVADACCEIENISTAARIAPGLGDVIRYAERDHGEINGIVSRIQETESGRKVFTVMQELLDRSNKLVTTRLYEGNAEIEIIKKGGAVVMDKNVFRGVLLPDVYLAAQLADMEKRAIAARIAANTEALRPKFLICRDNHFVDAQQDVIDYMNKAEAGGQQAIITDSLSGESRYTLYLAGYKIEYNGDWQSSSRGPAGEDPVRMALRYRAEEDIVAMTHAAKKAIDDRRVEIEALRQEEKDQKAAVEAARLEDARLRSAHTERLLACKFKKAQMTILAGSRIDADAKLPIIVDANVFQGAAVHKSMVAGKKGYVVTHFATGLALVNDIPSKWMANLVAARLATAGNLCLIKSRADTKLPVMAVFTEIALAIRESGASRCGIDPLVHPEFDAHLLPSQK